MPRIKWLKGRVIEVRKDDQGLFRSFKLKVVDLTNFQRIVERPVNKLVLLYREDSAEMCSNYKVQCPSKEL